MPDSPESSVANNQRGDRSRLYMLMLVGLAAVALLLSFEPSLLSFWSLRLYSVIIALMPGLLLAAGCAGCGDLLVRSSAKRLSVTDRLLISFAAGIGIVSCMTGLAGFSMLLSGLALPIVIIGAIVGFPLWRSLLVSARA